MRVHMPFCWFSHEAAQLLLLLFFTVKLDATNSFPSNTAEVRPIYLKMGHITRNLVFCFCLFVVVFLSYINNKGAEQPAHPRSLISAFVVRGLDSNEILQFKAI